MSKGSNQRPKFITDEEMQANWDKAMQPIAHKKHSKIQRYKRQKRNNS